MRHGDHDLAETGPDIESLSLSLSIGNSIGNIIQKLIKTVFNMGPRGPMGNWTRGPRGRGGPGGLGTINKQVDNTSKMPHPHPPSQTKLTHWSVIMVQE